LVAAEYYVLSFGQDGPSLEGQESENGGRLVPGRWHDLTRRTVIVGAIGAAGTIARPFVARAQNWPSGATIKLVVPYPPGGSTDVIARLIQPMLQQRLAATIVIDNRPGASGSVGTAAVAKSPPDETRG
jgi:tripartite-type tricarboxylate transporter receptor subunit TctC